MRFLITGTAGFIGFHLARRLIAGGHFVSGVDGMTPYYDVTLKQARHAVLARSNAFTGHIAMLEDFAALQRIASDFEPEIIVHLAAQAGVRYSLLGESARGYVDANLVGTFNIMEMARTHEVGHFLLASTSSAYGANPKMPFAETDQADHPLTLYAATKKATEAMTHSYAHLWDIPTTAFRFFTVYGPWGRPDMALFKFVQGDARGRGDRRLWKRADAARLHLYRRSRRGGRPARRPPATRRRAGRGDRFAASARGRPGESSISAAASRSACSTMSMRSRR